MASASALEIAPARRGVAILSRRNDGKHLLLDIGCTAWELNITIRLHFCKLCDRIETVDQVGVDRRSGVDVDKVGVDKRSGVDVDKVGVDRRSGVDVDKVGVDRRSGVDVDKVGVDRRSGVDKVGVDKRSGVDVDKVDVDRRSGKHFAI